MISRVTLDQIAAASGKSVATVSKVLNGRPGVGTPTRDDILRLADEYGYQPRGTQTRKPAKLIDLVMRGIDNPWATCVLAGAEREAARAGVGLVVSVTHGRSLGNPQWLDRLKQRHTDGLILVVSRLNEGMDRELARLRVPYVIVDPLGSAPPGVPVVGATNTDGARLAVDHLTGLGHHQIAIITGPPEIVCAQERLDGYRAGLARAGIPENPRYIHYGDFETLGGYRAANALFALPDRPTAIFAGSDLQASGVYRAARRHNLRIPDDVSVVGFDDSSLCEWLVPYLTTVRQPLEDMAAEATRILIAMTTGVTPSTSRLNLATSLVIRESTAPPPER